MSAVATDTVINAHAVPLRRGSSGRRHAGSILPPLEQRDHEPRTDGLPRSASYTFIPHAEKQAFAPRPSIPSARARLSHTRLAPPQESPRDCSSADTSGSTTPDERPLSLPRKRPDNLIAALSQSAKLKRTEQAQDDSSSVSTDAPMRPSLDSERSVRTVSTYATACTTSGASTPRPRVGSQASFSRTAGLISSEPGAPGTSPDVSLPSSRSRSSSPQRSDPRPSAPGGDDPAALTKSLRRRSLLKRKDSAQTARPKSSGNASATVKEQTGPDGGASRMDTIFRRRSRRKSLVSGAADDAGAWSDLPAPAIPAFPKSFSTDRLPLRLSSSSTPLRSPTVPTPRLLTPTARGNDSTILGARKKDELWNVFRTLDADYTKFASKSTAFKANVVRTSLLPFLRTYAVHSSTESLRAEDLDRRANILNKWWTGLIEMLHGRNNQSISGTDRPAILDGVAGIMDRPEWRLPPSPLAPLDQRANAFLSPHNRSTVSVASSAQSDFLVESVLHNVRNIFVQNLSAQMAFVVDKMSMRNASASLVAFCGKACAYAFMFVPGMADILVRLWDLPMDTLRRALQENGVGKFDDLTEVSAHTVASFPPALQPLGFVSLMKYMKKLRTPPPLPLGTTNIQWWGYWLERWTGRDSDLFYVFVKHFHILIQDFLPEGAGREQCMCAPGMLLVHAQVLANLDATIHREANQLQTEQGSNRDLLKFDVIPQADPELNTSANPFPPARTNAVRMMAENRLVMLVREFSSDRLAEQPAARSLFAVSFNNLLQAAAKGVSMFDGLACYTLLDFLEEALPMLVRFEPMMPGRAKIIDVAFWTSVLRKMMDSQSTMTELRLYSFLYTVWNTVIIDAARKEQVCFGFLLDPDVFESRFNHWCPMVRAYYMRLLCWRIGRCDGDATDREIKIMETLLVRLQTSWAYYLYLRDAAAANGRAPPPTNTSNAAPGRRLLIIRTDNQPVIPGHSFVSFDALLKPAARKPVTQHVATREPVVEKRLSVLSTFTLNEPEKRTETSVSTSNPEMGPRKGFKDLFKSMFGGKDRPRTQGPTTAKPSGIKIPPRSDSLVDVAATATTGKGRNRGISRAATEGVEQRGEQRRSSMFELGQPDGSATTPQGQKQRQQRPHLRHHSSSGDNRQQHGQRQHKDFSFKFSLEHQPTNKPPPPPQLRLVPPRLPLTAQRHLQARSEFAGPSVQLRPREPRGESVARARYSGRALAEWTLVVGECQSFIDRRLSEGVPGTRWVETPTLGVDGFRRPS